MVSGQFDEVNERLRPGLADARPDESMLATLAPGRDLENHVHRGYLHLAHAFDGIAR